MDSIHIEIERRIRAGDGAFESLALDLFAYQFERNRPYQAFCRATGRTPETVREWRQIPAVPIHAFKSSALATFPSEQAAAVFHSSATTSQVPSCHYIRDLRFYEASLKTSFAKAVLQGRDARLPFFILTPPPGEAPHSSLTWMMEVTRRQWGSPASGYFIQRGRVDGARLSRALEKTEIGGEPVLLLGTTRAFLAFFEELEFARRAYRLPGGSKLMDTGGMKTDRREVSRAQFVERAGRCLGLPPNACVNEYGMCELSSQFYSVGNDPVLRGPAWTRTLVIDAETGRELSDGEMGILKHVDLANVDSVAAIQTDDLGRKNADGFELLGRAPGADRKGCSLAAEQYLGLS